MRTCVVTFIRAQRRAFLVNAALCHRFRSFAFGRTGRLRQHRIGHQTTAVFHQCVPNPAELDGLMRTFAGQHGIGIRFADVRFVAALCAFEIDPAITT